MVANNKEEEIVVFKKDEVLFRQGDPGGDLFFILQGQIEIYTQKDQQVIVLTRMSAGEVIGILTCLTNDPRMACARALTEVTCKKVKFENVTRLVKDMPPWMRTVLKEYSNRLTYMNKIYGDASTKIDQLKTMHASTLYTAAQICATISTIGKYLAKTIDGENALILDEVVDHLTEYLCRPKEEILSLLEIIIENGILKIFIEKDKKRKCFTMANASSTKTFSDFILNSNQAKNKSLLQANFSTKEIKGLSGMVRYAQKMGISLTDTIKLTIKDLHRTMEKTSGTKFNPEAVQKAHELGLLEFEDENENKKIVFNPSTLGSTMSFLATYKKLEKLSESQAT